MLLKNQKQNTGNNMMTTKSTLSQKGITLIELLVALVIGGIIIGGIYRLFVAQTKAYTVQDQIVEVQQNIRSTMEILLRDLRMTGFDDDINPGITFRLPPDPNQDVYILGDNSITVNYEYYDKTALQYQRHSVAYWRDAATLRLIRQLTIDNVAGPQEALLENVEALQFIYGVDTNDDRVVENWVSAGAVGISKVIAIRVRLTAKPEQGNPDVQKMVSPRTLESIITLRNISLIK
jgi:prepilin-type N-terminal cleavage/methylation domain-containing protein